MCTVKLFGHIMRPCSVQTAGFPYNIHRCGSRKVIDFSIPVAQTAHLVTTTKPATKASPKRLSGCCPTPHPTWRMQLELLYTMPTKKHTNSCRTLAHRSTCAGDARWRLSSIIVVGLRHQAVARRGANVHWQVISCDASTCNKAGKKSILHQPRHNLLHQVRAGC